MTYGLKIVNPGDELVLSSEARGLHCIGKAVLQGSVVQPTGVATDSTPGRVSGYSLYRISHPGSIVVAIDLPLGYYVAIESVTDVGGGVWEIRAQCGNSLDADAFISTQVEVAVWAYGLPQTAPSGWGMAIFDAAGVVAWDLTKPNPLFARGYIGGAGSAFTLPSLTRPVLIGQQSSYSILDQPAGGSVRSVWTRWMSFNRGSSTALSTILIAQQRYRYNSPDPVVTDDVTNEPTSSFIVEGSTLP